MPQPLMTIPAPDNDLLPPAMQAFIREHRTDDVRLLALKAPRGAGFDLTVALEQIAGWQAARRKLPSWAANDAVVYPRHLSMEQCSSESTARYKAEVARWLFNHCNDNGNDNDHDHGGTTADSATPSCGERHDARPREAKPLAMADLTGGLGVDFAFLAPLFQRAVYNERDSRLCGVARHNFKALGLDNTEVINGEAEAALDLLPHLDLLFLDPARRDGNGSKTVAIADCSPDVAALLPRLLAKATRLMLKLSPMLDWHKAMADLRGAVAEVHIVGTGGECKELLLVCDSAEHDAVRVVCANDSERFAFSLATAHGAGSDHRHGSGSGDATACPQATQPPLFAASELMEAAAATAADVPLHLLEPNATVMKAGCFGLLASRFGLEAVGRDSHLFVARGEVEGFPGRQFTVKACSTMNRRSLKDMLRGVKKANVSVRNLPLSADALRRKLGVADGGDTYIFGTTASDGSHVVLLCSKG